MDTITAPLVYNLRREKEQPTLKLNNKIIFRSLVAKYNSWSATKHSRQIGFLKLTLCDMVQTHPAKGDSILLQKWIWLTLSLGIKLENRAFSTFHMRISISTDLGTIFIITPSYTSICQCNPSSDWDYEIFRNLPYVHVGWLLLPVLTKENDSGALLLGLAKSIYYIELD